MKNYFSKEFKCDICDSELGHEEVKTKLSSNDSKTSFICKNCNAEYKLNNMIIWPVAVLLSQITYIVFPYSYEIPLIRFSIFLLGFWLANQFRKYLSFLKLIKNKDVA